MKCNKCDKEAVFKSTNQQLCKEHYFNYFESKVIKTIHKYRLIQQDDNVCVACSGGKDSASLLHVLNKYCKKRNIKLFALSIDEGIQGYRNESIDSLREYCKAHNIQLEVFSFLDNYGQTIDQLREKGLKKKKNPCTICGILRRSLLNKKARELGATKLATGHNMDDEQQNILMNLMKGNMGNNAKLGPNVGISNNEKFVPRIKPLYHVLDKETSLYAKLKEFDLCFCECPHSDMSFRRRIKQKMNQLEEEVPGVKNGIVNSFLEINPLLKEKYKNTKPFSYCEKCGDPSIDKICNACKLIEEFC